MMETNLDKIKRIRTSNWTQDMKELLRDMVSQKIEIIDSKNNSAVFIQLKQNAWKSIESSMKASGFDIPAKKLKEQWNRMKTQARTNISNFRREQRATGGGEYPKEPSEFDFTLSNIAGIDFEADEAEFDSDAMNKTQSTEKVECAKENDATNANLNNTQPIKADEKRADKMPTKRRRTATNTNGDEMVSQRIKQIKQECKDSEQLMKLRLEVEETKLKHLKELHDIDLKIKNKELELITLKVEREKNNTNLLI